MRIKSGVTTRRHKKRYFKIAKGSYGDKRTRWRAVRQQVEKSLTHGFTGRKDRKGEFRSLWVTRINAAAREEGMSYSRFMAGLKKAGVAINRKMLSEMALRDAASFKKLAALSKAA
ncbi:MAG TPA: 50S ribosomal protein L20 [Elusimicrobiota bacterium]|nr:50S ribosomal protein L20 [Elusimicrobiota bacterium]